MYRRRLLAQGRRNRVLRSEHSLAVQKPGPARGHDRPLREGQPEVIRPKAHAPPRPNMRRLVYRGGDRYEASAGQRLQAEKCLGPTRDCFTGSGCPAGRHNPRDRSHRAGSLGVARAPIVKLRILDAETYFARAYSLRRLNPASYILDSRFELIGIAVKEPGSAAYWVEGPDAPAFFASLDPDDTMTASHNALFDNCVWAYRYGFVPRVMVDTLGVARAMLSLKNNSLASVAEYLGLGAKGKE